VPRGGTNLFGQRAAENSDIEEIFSGVTTTRTGTTTKATTPTGTAASTGIRAPVAPSAPTTPPRTTTAKAIPPSGAFSLPSTKQCVSKRKFTIHVRDLPGITWASAVIKLDHKRVKTLGATHITALVNLTGLPKGTFVLSITAKATNGRTLTATRTYHTCIPKRKSR
jgi:hypothetical protein